MRRFWFPHRNTPRDSQTFPPRTRHGDPNLTSTALPSSIPRAGGLTAIAVAEIADIGSPKVGSRAAARRQHHSASDAERCSSRAYVAVQLR